MNCKLALETYLGYAEKGHNTTIMINGGHWDGFKKEANKQGYFDNADVFKFGDVKVMKMEQSPDCAWGY
tara:strand:+ start:253 stop:459 length:207 start_codon:yes stop_codon:yes gene_type:complete